MIKVSVIIPIYNVEKYLRECLDSVVNQTLKDIEIILINNGSTDSSVEIIEEYKRVDNRIKSIDNKINVTAGEARNQGLEIAKGEYLSFLDSDDWFEVDMLEKAYNVCKNNNSDIGIFNGEAFDSDTRLKLYDIKPPYFFRKKFNNKKFMPIECKENLFNLFSPVAWNKLFKTTYVKHKGLKFQEILAGNDNFFVLSSLFFAKNLIYINNNLVHYRQKHQGNLTSCRRSVHSYEVFEFTKKILTRDVNFELFCSSFYRFFSENLWSYMLIESKDEFLKIKDLLAKNNSFDYEVFKTFYCDILNNYSFEEIKNMNHTEMFYSFYSDKVLKYINQCNRSMAIWGAGRNGQAFFNVFNEKLNIIAIIDNDSKKQGTCIKEIKISDFLEIKDKIDFVIVTNRNFYEEILLQVKEVDNRIKVIDIDSFLNFEVDYEDCVE